MGEYDAKPEDMKFAVKVGTDLAGTIDKLKANGFQYATAGDTRRLIEGIAAAHIAGLKEARDICRCPGCAEDIAKRVAELEGSGNG